MTKRHSSPAAADTVGSVGKPPGWGELAPWKVCRVPVVAAFRLLWRPVVVHGERIPPTGPYVLAPVHRSALDPFFLVFLTKRRIRYMGKAELWKYRWLVPINNALGGIPVDRSATDRTAMRAALAALEGGEPLGVFPEGTRRQGPVVEDLHDGVAFIAARKGVPIVPVGIGGSEAILEKGRTLPRPGRVVMVVGEPIHPPPREGPMRRGDLAAMTERLRQSLEGLLAEAEAKALERKRH